MDRNNVAKCKKTIKQVALRKESVDRNIWPVAYDATGHAVALRKESVDRNFDTMQVVIIIVESLSARRAWIEIGIWLTKPRSTAVALRKESVDRNEPIGEITLDGLKVALRKESVDRNICAVVNRDMYKSRSP